MFWRQKKACDCELKFAEMKSAFAVIRVELDGLAAALRSVRSSVNRSKNPRDDDETRSGDLEKIKALFGGELPIEIVRDEMNKKRESQQ